MKLTEKQKAFLAKHPGSWITKFATAVKENATTNFYQNLAVVTNLFVQQDLANISQLTTVQLEQMLRQHVI